jgi:hypothetical protein
MESKITEGGGGYYTTIKIAFFGFGFVLFETSLAMQPRLATNSQFSCLSLPDAGIIDVCHHHAWLKYHSF